MDTIKAWKKIKAKHKTVPVCRHPGKLEDLLTLPAYDLGQLVTLDDTIPIVTALTDTDDGGPGVTTVVTDDSPLAPMVWQEQVAASLPGGYVQGKSASVPEPACFFILVIGLLIAGWLRRTPRV